MCVDLLRKGFQVFRNVSPNGLVDLIAERDGEIWRVQVKSTIHPLVWEWGVGFVCRCS